MYQEVRLSFSNRRVARKPVFDESDMTMLNPACLATETSRIVKISHVARQDVILSNKRITKALIRQVCPFVFRLKHQIQIFLRRGQTSCHVHVRVYCFCDLKLMNMTKICQHHRLGTNSWHHEEEPLIGTASTNSMKFRGISPWMYIEDLL